MDQLSYAAWSRTAETSIEDLYAFHAVLDDRRRARRAPHRWSARRRTRRPPPMTSTTLDSWTPRERCHVPGGTGIGDHHQHGVTITSPPRRSGSARSTEQNEP